MGAVVLDAGVVIAHADRSNVHHERASSRLRALLDDDADLVLPVSAYAEFLVGPAQADDADGALRAADHVLEALDVRVSPASRDVGRAAARLRARHGKRLRLPDALVVATAQTLGAERILTTDAGWPPLDLPVELVGP